MWEPGQPGSHDPYGREVYHLFLQQLINGVTLGTIFSLIALGYSMVYGVLFFVNFAHADVMMFGAYFCLVFASAGVPLIASVILAMICCACMGALIEFIAYRALRGSSRLVCMASALGVSTALQISAQLIWGSGTRSMRNHISLEIKQHYITSNAYITNLQLITIVVAVCMMIGLQFYLKKTRSGKALRATAEDREAAALMGINTNSVITLTFMIGSAMAAIGGFLVAMQYDAVYPTMSLSVGNKAFASAILGGIGNIPGAMVGGVLIGIAESLGAAYLSSQYREAIAFVILILVLLIKPTGIMGKRQKK